MSKSKPDDKTAPHAPLTTLAEIQSLCAQYRRIEFELHGRPCALEVRDLTAAEHAAILAITDAVNPPVIKGRTPEEDRLDWNHADYVRKKTEAALKGRAQGIYWAVPELQKGKPNLVNLDEIQQYVQSNFTEGVLNLLWKACSNNDVKAADLVNFI